MHGVLAGLHCDEGTAVIFTVLLMPPLLLCALLALGRYEEHVFRPEDPKPDPHRAHLRAVPATKVRPAPTTTPPQDPAHRRRPGGRAA
jgi:hypothetical protein